MSLLLGHTDTTTRQALCTFAAALLVVVSFPPFGLWPLAFVALVPLHAALRNSGRGTSARDAAVIGFGFGMLVCLGLFRFLLAVPFVRAHHFVVLAAYLALFSSVLAVAWSKLPGSLALPLVPALAVSLDWLRGHAGFLALPWGTMGQTQSENLFLLQWASIGGEHLVTFAVVAVNVAFAELLDRGRGASRGARPVVTLGLVALAHVLGAAMVPRREGITMRVAAIQANVAPSATGAESGDSFETLSDLTKKAVASKPDLVVWPESSAGDTEHDMLALFRARAIVDAAGVPVLFGASNAGGPSERGYNSLYLMTPGEPMPSPYRKVRLVPFAEYAPIAADVGPRMFDTAPGSKRFTYEVAGVDVEPLICFESLFADDVRETASSRPSIIALAVNDAWFGKSAAPAMHNLVSVFRAVENRRPVVIASNAGPSTIIDGSGRVVVRAHAFAPDTISATVRVDMPAGPYRRWGDRVPFGFALVLVVAALARYSRSERGMYGDPEPERSTAASASTAEARTIATGGPIGRRLVHRRPRLGVPLFRGVRQRWRERRHTFANGAGDRRPLRLPRLRAAPRSTDEGGARGGRMTFLS